ncbi:MAG: site-specific integrase [Gammaproteobacteria bacterium SHHR-1]
MPYKRKDSPIWWVSYIDQSGKRVRCSTGTTDRKEAEALEAKWKLEAYNAKQWGEEPERSFEELMLAYLNATGRTRRPKSQEAVLMHIKRLKETFAGVIMNRLQPALISQHIQARQVAGRSNATINRELEVLSAAITWANREGWRLPNPVSNRMLKEPEGRVRWITRAEAAALLKAAEAEPKAPHLAPLILLALHTGMRRGEMLGLEWTRVDLHRNLVYLDAVHTKAGKRRSVPLNVLARSALLQQARFRSEHCPDSRWVFCKAEGKQVGDVKRSFATACKRADILDFRFHDLRHTCAAWLVQAGVPLTEVRDVLGHSTIQMTERYAHLAPENARAAVALLANEVTIESRGNEKGLAEIS